ncbi:MAG: UDP diphospho-muramoyl pentapeptide beta-N acetylglucosaminyl transferase [Parcubacteria group bacterium GW2011_GWC1_42_11]|uniref:UDP-N-acetylglucosamine--N-acetylmuramyl-(pentapeptide) pyrophosphoryl-undecaprenol N-acetylglucosamine transferase n=1 Tax=Candidatus Nomurabacteria bacterium GW2011_GWC2_42_20 TaxID=1618756 RepID=A0A0G1CBK5_9BACT|nr:MAG: UDP diphospho-muramoyl pentapeptide beta-N acetylglucosaminyl transferase [Parcubacteria group bacterium GW2011_GWC1_42_11]KKS47028.1 MAG: UDP diphospho-muramoyl pentapeptide beta-N acetylglucosaminyl transferase [Candidatus Nomurabacteria bacterium GW2011_GWC2_42_20]KKS59233.1 MAG: UDP diphospho-muramoyl pentapeptide beta-N acetylglucosaminyl transferase [Candidatus Nomurabacteria bacterium GW2011_GWA2_42_41]KKT09168.1 MAG: UDP diphospho-muramoyl pentapeptide beta-N acetylglucosaminyl t
MKILFTGGGSGGHFYPIIAVAEKLNKMLEREKIAKVELYYMSTEPYNERLLYDNKIIFKPVIAGKMRGYFSIQNFFDVFKMAWGVLKAFFQIFSLYPDVIFGKGGFPSFPVLFVARFFRIPVIIHESDSVPGRVNAWAGKFAQKIAISYAEAAQYFPAGRTALTGNPIRNEILQPSGKDAFKELGLDPNVPVLLVLGGSQGARIINSQIETLAPRLVEKYQIIHQTGEANIADVEMTVMGLLGGNPNASRYHIYGYMDSEKMKLAAEVATIVVSRAGSAIFEIAAWGVPAILIPIANHVGDHQRNNAFAYARAGGAVVIEEANLGPNILMSEIEQLMADTQKRDKMKESAKAFARTDSAEKIAEQIVAVLLRHQALK